jgi:FkbM family methyltransferase
LTPARRRHRPWVKKLLLYSLRMGLQGPLLMRRLGQPGPLVDLVPPGAVFPFHLRPGTSDVISFQEVFLDRDYAVDLPAAPRLIVDVGANIGATAVFFALRYPGSQILAFEPEPRNCDLLRRNAAPYPAISVDRTAVWPHESRLAMADPEAAHDSFSYAEAGPENSEAAETVGALSLEDLLRRHGIGAGEPIDLLKIDVEGAEVDLFRQTPPWLDRVQTLVIELHEVLRPGCTALVQRHLPSTAFEHRRCGVNHVFIRRRPA